MSRRTEIEFKHPPPFLNGLLGLSLLQSDGRDELERLERRHFMFSNPYFFLLFIAVIGLISKNNPLIIAAVVLMVFRLIHVDQRIFDVIQAKGINVGITIITIAVLAPIATGKVDFSHFGESLKSPYTWIAVLSGVIVSVLARGGIQLLSTDPEVTVALVFGSILAVTLFKGVPVGPLIGAGIAYMFMRIVDFFK